MAQPVGESTKDRILVSAIQLMSEDGFNAVSMRAIAKDVGVHVSSLYNHYRNKAELLDAVVGYIHTRYPVARFSRQKVVDLLKDSTPEAILRKNIFRYREEDQQQVRAYRLLYLTQFTNDDICGVAYRYFFQEPAAGLREILDVFVDLSLIPRVDTDCLAYVWTRSTVLFAFRAMHTDMPCIREQYDRLVNFLIKCTFQGVQPLRDLPVSFTKIPGEEVNDADVDYGNPSLPTARRLMAATYTLLDEVGDDKITMRMICEKVGIQPGSVYNHFDGKDHLIAATIEAILGKIKIYGLKRDMLLSAFRSGDLEQVVVALAECNADMNVDYHRMGYRIVYREQYRLFALRDMFWKILLREQDELSQVLDLVSDEGAILPCPDSREVAMAYLFTMASIHISCVMAADEVLNMHRARKRVGSWVLGLVYKGYMLPQKDSSAL